MSIDETADKLDKYRKRVKKGKAHKIKPKHVKEIRQKLHRKRGRLDEEINNAETAKERDRLAKKRATVDHLIDRADWLRSQL
ncbi:MAG: hypothetical protein WBG36_15090 [Ornithinimicrobium sp.]